MIDSDHFLRPWINFYDPDDVLAFPLKGLSEEYDVAVDEDVRCRSAHW